ncbi:unnamed protein product [Lampetra fluviatilis]
MDWRSGWRDDGLGQGVDSVFTRLVKQCAAKASGAKKSSTAWPSPTEPQVHYERLRKPSRPPQPPSRHGPDRG